MKTLVAGPGVFVCGGCISRAHAALATVYYRLKRTADGDRETAEARRVREEAQKLLEEKRKPALSEKQ